MYTMTVRDVAVLARMAKSTKPRTRRDAWFAAKAAVARLKQHSAGELALAPDVRLPLAAVVSLLWRLRKSAMADWYAAKAAEEWYADYDDLRLAEHLAQLQLVD